MQKRVAVNLPCRMKYCNEAVDVYLEQYGNNRWALRTVAPAKGDHPAEPMATLTVNLPNEECGPNEVYVKDWSENEGAEAWMLSVNLIEGKPVSEATTGFVTARRYKLGKRVQPHIGVEATQELQGQLSPAELRQGRIDATRKLLRDFREMLNAAELDFTRNLGDDSAFGKDLTVMLAYVTVASESILRECAQTSDISIADLKAAVKAVRLESLLQNLGVLERGHSISTKIFERKG